MKLKRTIYAGKDEMISRMQVERQQVLDQLATTGLPRYRREFLKGKAEGMAMLTSMIEDWAGEEEPEPCPVHPDAPGDY